MTDGGAAKRRPNFIDPWAASKVSTFMEPAECGRWKIVRFEISERHAAISYAMAIAEGGSKEEREVRAARTIPPGTYLSLQRLAVPGEIEDIEDGSIADGHAADGDPRYVPVMSDTPTEIREHYEAIEGAHGDVVITGLGLGCIVSALLAKPTVKTITVVEIDRDVIALTAPYYADNPRVKIVNMDALTAAMYFHRQDAYFDFAWHDIWSHISDRNLDDDDLAEHGISYETMFEAWSFTCEDQAAWAYREARHMEYHKELQRERLKRWSDAFTAPDASDEERIALLIHFHVVNMLHTVNIGDEIPDEIYAFVVEQMGVREMTTQQIERRGGLAQMVQDIRERADVTFMELDEDSRDPMHRPNEAPEANVAR